MLKVFNMLPSYINIESDNPEKFKLVLKKFLYKNFFHSVDGHFELQKKLLFIYDLRSIWKYGTGNRHKIMLDYIFSFCIHILELVVYML